MTTAARTPLAAAILASVCVTLASAGIGLCFPIGPRASWELIFLVGMWLSMVTGSFANAAAARHGQRGRWSRWLWYIELLPLAGWSAMATAATVTQPHPFIGLLLASGGVCGAIFFGRAAYGLFSEAPAVAG